MSREELESLKERLNELTAEKDEASEDMSQETTQDMTASRATVDGEENPDNSAES